MSDLEETKNLIINASKVADYLKNCSEDNCNGCLYKIECGCVSSLLKEAAGMIDKLIAALPLNEDCEAMSNPKKDVLLVKVEYVLLPGEMESIRHKILRELREGVVILPKGFEPWLIPEDVEVRVVGK